MLPLPSLSWVFRLLQAGPANSGYSLGAASWEQLSHPIRMLAVVLVEDLVVVPPLEKFGICSLLRFLVVIGTRTLGPQLSQVLAANQFRIGAFRYCVD